MPKDLRVLQQPSVTQTQGQLREDPGWSLNSNQLIPGWQSIAKRALLAQWELLAYRLPVGREPCEECALAQTNKTKTTQIQLSYVKETGSPHLLLFGHHFLSSPFWKITFFISLGKWTQLSEMISLLEVPSTPSHELGSDPGEGASRPLPSAHENFGDVGRGLANSFLVHTRILGMWSWRREISSAVELSFLKQFPHLPGTARFSALPLSSSLVILVVSLPWCFCCGCCVSLLFPVIAHVCTQAHTQTFLLCFANLHQIKSLL